MRIVPINQKDANLFVGRFHRHHKRVVGSIFQVGCRSKGELIGVAICGRPVGRKIDFTKVIEVTRLCVFSSTPNACSKLYAACSRVAKEMGYYKIITYTLESEPGISLKAAGWINDGRAGCKSWNSSGNRIRTNVTSNLFEQAILKSPEEFKTRWYKILNHE